MNNSVIVGSQGPQGIPGGGVIAGGLKGQVLTKNSDTNYDLIWSTIDNTTTNTIMSGQTIAALKVVYTDATTGKLLYADKDNINTIDSILGVSTEAASIDTNINILTMGILTDLSWDWDMTADVNLYLGINGAIIQGAPNGIVVLRIGYAINPTTIMVRIGTPIFIT